MSSRSHSPVSRPVLVGYCLILVCAAVAVLCAAAAPKAEAAYYKSVLCAANNGLGSAGVQTNTVSPQNPAGIFTFQNQCGGPWYPAGNDNFVRLFENQGGGLAGYQAYALVGWGMPSSVTLAGGGGYTRQPNDFADGWRTRLWGEGHDGSVNNFLMQGAGVDNNSLGGIGWARTSIFASHLWPFSTYGSYRRFVFEMTCMRPAGCERSGFNATDANTFVLTLNDVDPSRISFTNTGSGILSGAWVRGTQNVTWDVSDQGSGMRFDRLRVDGGTRHQIDWRGSCDLDANGASGEFARQFRPCPTGGPWGRSFGLDTASLSDGSHTAQVCSQDYGQAVGLSGSGGESCQERSIRVDNNPPAAPGGLSIATSNPARYLDHFGARWTLPSDPGSPIAKVHFNIVNAAGKAVVGEQVVSATNPTKLDDIAAPKAAGDYRLNVWLEDQVGLSGPVATVAIPHDTTPPAAPQEIAVTSPATSRSDQGFDVRWKNIVDAGAPIDTARYQVLDGAGNVVVATKELGATSPEIADLETPRGRGNYMLKLWLSDAEGNVGAPTEAPLSYSCSRSEVGGGQRLSVGIGEKADRQLLLAQDQGAKATGSLTGSGGPVSGAAVCVFSRVVTDGGRDFLGVAITGGGGNFAFPLAAGPSREVSAIYRADQRQIEATATALTQIKPTLKLRKPVVRNKRKAWFSGEIPGPHNDGVVIVLQVENGKDKWRAFRRYRTRGGGHYNVPYRFTQTGSATTYPIRAQVRQGGGLPYEPGNSPTVRLRVMP